MRRILCSLVVMLTPILAWAVVDRPPVTFNKDVLPILQRNCQGCHRPGEAAPMSLLTYQDARRWTKAIRDAVLQQRMPPWFADSQHGTFANDRSLSQAEIDTVVSWVDGGAREGDAADLPLPRKFVEGWNIGQPDLVFEMPKEFHVPDSGTIQYQYVVIPTGFTGDRWVQMAEVRPGNRALVHHAMVYVREPGSKWLHGAKPGELFEKSRRQRRWSRGVELLLGFVPGGVPQMLTPGQAKLIKAGSDLVFELHYTANGKAGTDRTRVGLVFAKEPPAEQVRTVWIKNRAFVIPAGAPNHRVNAGLTLDHDVILLAMLPHMHLRGKSVQYRAVYPTGESQILLDVPRYSFNWQLSYYLKEPLLLPKGTRIECMGYFDNSPNNPNNPDPTVEVRFGSQSQDEMLTCFMDVASRRLGESGAAAQEKDSTDRPSPAPSRQISMRR